MNLFAKTTTETQRTQSCTEKSGNQRLFGQSQFKRSSFSLQPIPYYSNAKAILLCASVSLWFVFPKQAQLLRLEDQAYNLINNRSRATWSKRLFLFDDQPSQIFRG